MATALMRRALDYLDRRGVAQVRLEVRPDNAPALAVYSRLGFRVAGSTSDSQGPWLIMLRSRPGLQPGD
ncbi:MAG: GNAT family N-acetyltransferase [Bacillota bacterium]